MQEAEPEEEKQTDSAGKSTEDMIQKLLEETANRLAQQISSGNYIGKEKQIEKILTEDIFGDDKEPDSGEKPQEEPQRKRLRKTRKMV